MKSESLKRLVPDRVLTELEPYENTLLFHYRIGFRELTHRDHDISLADLKYVNTASVMGIQNFKKKRVCEKSSSPKNLPSPANCYQVNMLKREMERAMELSMADGKYFAYFVADKLLKCFQKIPPRTLTKIVIGGEISHTNRGVEIENLVGKSLRDTLRCSLRENYFLDKPSKTDSSELSMWINCRQESEILQAKTIIYIIWYLLCWNCSSSSRLAIKFPCQIRYSFLD